MRGQGKITQADISWIGHSRNAKDSTEVKQYRQKNGKSIITTISKSIIYPEYEQTFACSLPSDSKPWRIGDMAVLHDGRLLVLDITNHRVKLFNEQYEFVTSKIVEDNCHSLSLVSKNTFSVMNSSSIYLFIVEGNRVSLDDKVELTGMHYGVISNGKCVCLVKLVSLIMCDNNFQKKSVLAYKTVSGKNPYTPRYMTASSNGAFLCYDDVGKCLICFDENGKRLWSVSGIQKCYGIESFLDSWIYLCDTEIVYINSMGQKCGKILEFDYEAECMIVCNEKRKLFVSDRSKIYVYTLDTSPKEKRSLKHI